MLSAFQAQAIHELKPKDKSKIESLLAYGDKLLVGLSTGSLRVYRINEDRADESGRVDALSAADNDATHPSKSKQKVIELLREEEKYSKRPIQQLAIVKEANVLISLSDGYISFHDLHTYTLVERLERTKGAVCFAVTSNVIKDDETSIPTLISRMVVGVKRKLMCWTWSDMELSNDVVEMSMEGVVKTLTWATDTRLSVGMDAGFTMVDVVSEEALAVSKPASRMPAIGKDDASPGELAGIRFAAVSSSGMGYMGMGSWVPKPMCTRVGATELLFAKDVNTLFTDLAGKPIEKRQVPWSHAPEAIGYSYPYLLALQPPERGALQIRNPDTLNLLQSIPLPQACILHVPQPRISLAHAGKGFLVASERIIWRMNALSYPSQIDELVGKGKYDEAVSFLQLLEDTLIDDKYGRIREVQTQKGEALFRERKYRPALDLFTDAQAAVDRVVRLYPRIIAGDLSMSPEEESASDDASNTDDASERIDSDRVVAPATPSKSAVERFKSSQTPQKPAKDVDSALVLPGHRADADTASVRSARTLPRADVQDTALVGDDLKQAVIALRSFLAQSRVQIQKYLNTSGKLKEIPIRLDPETHKPAFANLLPQELFEGPGPWHIDYEEQLLKVAQLVDTTLFRSYMLASPLLAGSLFRLDNFCDPVVVQTALYENRRYGDLLDFLHGKRLHRQSLEMLQKFGKGDVEDESGIPEGLSGPARSVAYLKQLPPDLIDLVLEFIVWPLQTDKELALTVFTADSDNAEHMDRHRVVSFLAEHDQLLEQQYLEHVIEEWHDQDSILHQRLVELYINALSSNDDAVTQHKLERTLRTSKTYNRGQTFRLLNADNAAFYESRAIVLTDMGNYKQALAIYVYQLQDYEKAEAHCARIFLEQQSRKDETDKAAITKQSEQKSNVIGPVAARTVLKDPLELGENVFAMLLALYLRPPDGEEKRWPQALELLSNHGSRLPASSTLDLMPDDLAVQQLQDYFRGQMRRNTSLLREDNIVKGLEGVRRVRAEATLLLGKNHGDPTQYRPQGKNMRVVVRDGDHCKVCHKRFGAYAVRSWPDGSVTHYGCVPGRAERSRGW